MRSMQSYMPAPALPIKDLYLFINPRTELPGPQRFINAMTKLFPPWPMPLPLVRQCIALFDSLTTTCVEYREFHGFTTGQEDA